VDGGKKEMKKRLKFKVERLEKKHFSQQKRKKCSLSYEVVLKSDLRFPKDNLSEISDIEKIEFDELFQEVRFISEVVFEGCDICGIGLGKTCYPDKEMEHLEGAGIRSSGRLLCQSCFDRTEATKKTVKKVGEKEND